MYVNWCLSLFPFWFLVVAKRCDTVNDRVCSRRQSSFIDCCVSDDNSTIHISCMRHQKSVSMQLFASIHCADIKNWSSHQPNCSRSRQKGHYEWEFICWMASKQSLTVCSSVFIAGMNLFELMNANWRFFLEFFSFSLRSTRAPCTILIYMRKNQYSQFENGS